MKRPPQPLRVGPTLAPRPGAPHPLAHAQRTPLPRARLWLMHAVLSCVFVAIAGQTVRLAASSSPETRLSRA